MTYNKIKKGIFIDRPNRFVAHVLIDGKEETVHVKNTGRCRELLIKGTEVILEESDNPKRKTKYSLIAVYKGKRLINMDSQAPNSAAFEAVRNGVIEEIGVPDYIKREVAYSKSRFDLYFEKDGKKGFIEVKGVTLEKDSMTYFPDAPTQRGTRHLEELIKAFEEGYEAYVLFVIQMKDVIGFSPNYETDLNFAKTLKRAQEKGVKVIAYACNVYENKMELNLPVKVIL